MLDLLWMISVKVSHTKNEMSQKVKWELKSIKFWETYDFPSFVNSVSRVLTQCMVHKYST